jgi:mycoredoxin
MVTMYTTSWCGYCIRLKRMLAREGIAFQEVNIEHDRAAAEAVREVNGGNRTVPTLVLTDGTALTNPSLDEVKTALSTMAS